MKNIRGKNALLTGGSMGIGPYVARALAQEGVNIALSARSEDKLKSVAAGLSKFDIQAVPVPADVTDATSRENLVEEVKQTFGHIDLLINNAGVEWVSAFTDLKPEDIDNLVQTNLIAPLMIARLVLPHMIKRGSGHVVTMSSLGGKKGQPYSATYAATKAGLIAWTGSVRAELYRTGVSASVICPGFISDVGMFAVYEKAAPKISGESKPEKVGEAVIRAIKKDLQEVVVNPSSIKPMTILDALNPEITTKFFRKTGLHEFYRDQAQDNLKRRQDKYDK